MCKCNVGARPTILTMCFKDTDACFVKCALDFLTVYMYLLKLKIEAHYYHCSWSIKISIHFNKAYNIYI